MNKFSIYIFFGLASFFFIGAASGAFEINFFSTNSSARISTSSSSSSLVTSGVSSTYRNNSGVLASNYTRNGYTYHAETKTYYKMFSSKTTWHSAMTHCLNDGASLVAPASKDEHENVVKLLPNSLDKSIWIGLHNFYKANKYLTSKGRLPRFTNWQAGQPNFSRSIQNRCVMMDNTHKYRNEECGARHMFVCAAKECKKNFANKACMTNDKGYKLSTQLNRCYKTYTTPSSWNEAFDKCEADNARLAVINSEEEAKFLKSIFKSTECSFSSITCDSSQAFIGMTDFLAPGMMLTIDGKTPAASGYDKWHSRIQSRKLADKCGTLHRFGELNRVSCDKKLGFICEKTVPTSTC